MFCVSYFFRSRSYIKALVLAVLVLSSLAACAENPAVKPGKPYALLFGTIWTANGHPLAGVIIHIRRAVDKKPKWTLVSDDLGEFPQRVPAGKNDYIVTATIKEKKKPAKTIETTVHVENDERVDFGLHLTE